MSDDITSNYHGGNEYSVAANPSENAKKRHRYIVFHCLKALGGAATCDQIIEHLGWGHQSVSPRWTELKKAGLIVATGERRPTRTGRTAGVYAVAPGL
jgi:predicted Rossmann fold nucleotide-binding protein DprA/Smf involved in DNA uptake